MGCSNSHPENQSAIDQEVVIVPFLTAQPRVVSTEEYQTSSYFPFDSYNPNIESPENKPTCQGDMIDHSTTAAVAEPDMELFKKQRFNECFSHIEVSTFQNAPIMSVQSHINMPNPEYQQSDSFNVQDYYQLIDQVMTKVIPPLVTMKVSTDMELTLWIIKVYDQLLLSHIRYLINSLHTNKDIDL